MSKGSLVSGRLVKIPKFFLEFILNFASIRKKHHVTYPFNKSHLHPSLHGEFASMNIKEYFGDTIENEISVQKLFAIVPAWFIQSIIKRAVYYSVLLLTSTRLL